MSTLGELRDDLSDEQGSLDDVVADLTSEQWRRATASPGWSVFDQIAHLAYFDERASLAISDPERFGRAREELVARMGTESLDDITLGPFRSLSAEALLDRWRTARQDLLRRAATLVEGARVEWYGPSMSAKSFLTARLMETWAHGIDVGDALDVTREPSDRLSHVVRLGLSTRAWSYQVRAMAVPEGTVRLELKSPRGETWLLGEERADDVVTGSAEDFCLVVTQRRHLDDTGLATGDLGRDWLLHAQAFAGAASDGPAPRGAR
jgi:uncharacterized protein (TIGR03084 family)